MKNKKKIANLIKTNRFVMFCYRAFFNTFFNFMGLFIKIDKKLVLLSSFGGDRYDDSPKAVFLSMKSDPRFSDYRFVWAFNEPRHIEGASVVKMDSLKYFITALKAKIWITNVNIERGLSFKKKKQIYLNTWHGSGPKKSGNAIKNRRDYNFGNVDILTVDGEYVKNVFIKYFRAKEESILWCGRPRDDLLLSMGPEQSLSVKQKLGISLDKKIILFAPTWRPNDSLNVDFNKWFDVLDNNYVVLFRLHHFDSFNSKIVLNKNVIDVSSYEDVNELFLISDYLISDYSSVFFDFGLLKKPFYCYAPDYDNYSINPGLFLDLNSLMYPKVFKEISDLLNHIISCDYTFECNECSKVQSQIVQVHNEPTKTCINRIYELVNYKK